MELGWILVKGEKTIKDIWGHSNMDCVLDNKKLFIFLGELRYSENILMLVLAVQSVVGECIALQHLRVS